MTLSQKYVVRFNADNGLVVSVNRDINPPKMTGGFGGWEIVDRPRKTALTQWDGRDPFRMDIPILFDGLTEERGQELSISILSRMALPPDGSSGNPPLIRVTGAVPRTDVTWVIEAIQWGDNVIWSHIRGSSVRLRQDAVVKLLQYVKEDRIVNRGGRSSQGNRPRTYAVHEGDTLRIISAKVYGDYTRWNNIAIANDITDPDTISPGQLLRIP
jgi:hypothetical protein